MNEVIRMRTLNEFVAERVRGGKSKKEIGILNDKIESRQAKGNRAFNKFMISKIVFDKKILRSYKIDFHYSCVDERIILNISIKNIVHYIITIERKYLDICIDGNITHNFSEYTKKYPDKFVDLKKYIDRDARNELIDYALDQNYKYNITDYYDYLQCTLLFLLCNKETKTFYRDIERLIAQKILETWKPKPKKVPSWLDYQQFMNNYYMMGGQ